MSVTPIEDLPLLHDLFRNRYAEMDQRHARIAAVVGGELDLVDPEEEKVETVSANLIQVAIEDTAEAASIMPTIRVVPHSTAQKAKKSAAAMERIGSHYLDISNFEMALPETYMRIAAYGLCPWVIWPDLGQNVPLLEMRSPRGCYPEPGVRPGQYAQRVMFTREVKLTQLPMDQQLKIREAAGDTLGQGWQRDETITIVELFTETEILIGAVLQSSGTMLQANGAPYPTLPSTTVQRVPVELERIPNPTGICLAIVASRPTVDGEFRGQFDQVIGPMRAHARLMALLLEYADQSVYSDIWVKDPIGEVSFGGGAYIRLGPQGAIGRVPPAVSALNVNADLQMLEEAVHLGGRWPKSRPGEIDQSIASAKFLEASAGMMNTVIKTLHLSMRDSLKKALAAMFRVDKIMLPGEAKTMHGVLRNQEFLEEYSTDDIDLGNVVKVEYGLGLGKDPSQSAVLHIQYYAQGFLSKQFVMESIEGLTDVGRELARMDVEQFRDIALAKILQGTQDGSISNRQIIEMARAREEGRPLFDLFEEYVVAPEEEAAANPGPMSGITGGPAGPLAALLGGMGGGPPGAGPGGPPGGPPGAPPGGPGGPPAPRKPNPPEMLARLGSPAGPPGGGSRLGTQVA